MDAFSMVPDAVLLPIELATDYDTWRNKPIEGQRLQDLPEEQRARWYSTNASRWLSRAVGGMSPVKWDHAIYRSSGGILTDVLRVEERGIVQGLFGFSRFVHRQERGESLNQFYDQLRKQKQHYKGEGGADKASPLVKHRYLEMASFSRLMAKLRAVSPPEDRDKEMDHQRYLTGLARFALGREELYGLYPNPLLTPPPEMRPVIDEFLSKAVWSTTDESQNTSGALRARRLVKRLGVSEDRKRKLLYIAAKRRKVKTDSFSLSNAFNKRLERLAENP